MSRILSTPLRRLRDGHCSERYASYWNAFLFSIVIMYFLNVDQTSRSTMGVWYQNNFLLLQIYISVLYSHSQHIAVQCYGQTCSPYHLHFYRPQRSCGKVMFLHLSVILFTGGGGVCRTPSRQTPSQADTPLLGKHTPPRQTPRPQRRPLQRPVHILLECILILI